MNLTATVKRAPKWAWYASGGIAIGVVGIEVWKRRATDTPAPADATNDATVVGGATGSAAPSPVITPPVIIPPSGDSPDYTGIFDVFGNALSTAMGTIGGLAAGDQNIAQTALTGGFDLARDSIAQAGQAPSPASQVGPIIVQVPTPATTPSTAPPKGIPSCPAGFPHRSSRGCYKCRNEKNKTVTHLYQSGAVVGGNKTC